MINKYFFDSNIRQDFDWKGKYHLRAGAVRPDNKKQISEGLREMSPESIRNRFLGSKRAFTEKELQYLTSLDGINHYAFGIEEREKLKRGVAIIRLVRSSHSESEAEVAITIIDEYQRMGLGAALLNIIILAALERKITKLSFTFLPENTGIVKLINSIGLPERGQSSQDSMQLFLDLKKLNVETIKSQLVRILPSIDTFHLKT